MPNLRSGKKYKVAPEHHGRYAHQNSVFSLKKRSDPSGPATRFQTTRNQNKRLKIADPSPSTPTKEQLVKLDRAKRSAKPTCLHFGYGKKEAEILFPNHFFCSHCECYIEAILAGSKRVKRDSENFRCEGNHTNWIAPTTFKEEKTNWLLFKRTRVAKEPEDEHLTSSSPSSSAHATFVSDEDFLFRTPPSRSTPSTSTLATRTPEEEEETRSIASTNQQESEVSVDQEQLDLNQGKQTDIVDRLQNNTLLSIKLNQLQFKYDELLSRRNAEPRLAFTLLQEKYDLLTKRHQLLVADSMDPKSLTSRALNLPFKNSEQFDGSDVVLTPKLKQKKAETFVRNVLMQSNFMDGLIRDEIIKQAKRHIRETDYAPWKILRLKDRHGGRISLDTIDLLRTLETKEKKYVSDTILCSSSSIKRVSAIVESFAKSIVPYSITDVPREHGKGEVISFELKDVLPIVLRATGLYEAAKERRIEIPQSCDATNITKNVSFIIYGIKVKDRAAHCPITKRPLYLPASDDNAENSLIQSFENCIPVKVVIGKETKELVNEMLKENFDLLNAEDSLGEVNDSTSSILGEEFKPLISPCNADKKMHWAGLSTGGAAKVHKLPCSCCAVQSSELATPNSTLCDRWCQQWKDEGKLDNQPNWQCFHKPMVTPERIEILEQEADKIRDEIGDLAGRLESLIPDSKLNCTEDPRGLGQGNSSQDPESIHFWHNQSTPTDRNAYLMSLAHDLALRHMDTTGTIDEMQKRLKEVFRMEYVLRQTEADVAHGTVSRASALYLIINAIPCILHLENRVGLKIFTRLLRIGLDNTKKGVVGTATDTENQRIKSFIKRIEDICNSTIWGSDESPVRWILPYDTQDKKITTISLDNVKTRKIIDSVELLVEVCIEEGPKRELWISTITQYREGLSILRKRADLSDQEIFDFQWKIDQFGQGWMKINMGVEGVTNYIHDLYAGHISDYLIHWRNLYSHSQQGWEAMNFVIKKFWFRCTNRGGGKSKNRLEPLARWILRRFVWMMGFEYEYIFDVVKNGLDVNLDDMEENMYEI
jgi:hypothetical protein